MVKRCQDISFSSTDRSVSDFSGCKSEYAISHTDDSPVFKFSRATGAMDINDVHTSSSPVVPPLDLALAIKFRELTRSIKLNRKKHNLARQSSEGLTFECPSDALSPSTTPPTALTRSMQFRARNSIDLSSTDSSAKVRRKGAVKKRFPPAANAEVLFDKDLLGSKQILSTKSSIVAFRKASSKRAASHRLKAHNDVSLSDLKAEHQEALQILRELGDPVDPDNLQLHDARLAKGRRLGRGSDNSTGFQATGRKSRNQLVAQISALTLPASANATVGMVAKFKQSVSSCVEKEVTVMEQKSTQSLVPETICE